LEDAIALFDGRDFFIAGVDSGGAPRVFYLSTNQGCGITDSIDMGLPYTITHSFSKRYFSSSMILLMHESASGNSKIINFMTIDIDILWNDGVFGINQYTVKT
jgi:hypothetical protein